MAANEASHERDWADSTVVIGDLGPLTIDGTRLDTVVGSRAQRAILVALAASQHQGGLDTDRLIEFVWPGEESNRRRVWDSVHRLRAALAAAGIDLAPVNGGGRYHFDRPVSLDSDRFRALTAEASATLDDDVRRARSLLDTALGLWRGQAYDGFDIELLRPGLTRSLEEDHQVAGRMRARASLAIDGPEAAIGELEGLASDHPFDENVAELLVVALRDAGRRVDAIRRLRRFAAQLQDELGVGVGARLAALGEELTADELTDDELTGPTGPQPLRAWHTSFIGRADELQLLSAATTSHRLVTIVGPAGVGKTRLATELTRTSPGGQGAEAILVDLTATYDPANIDAVVAGAVGLNETTSRAALRQYLERADRLVVLDNCEHLIDAAARLVAELLAATTRTRFLATSRLPLRIPGEHLFRLDPLDVSVPADASDAVRLFLDRAGLELDDLSPDDRRHVEEIVAGLDGLPLAIELAAARTESLGLAEVTAGLDDRFALLAAGARSDHPRHRSLQAMVSWSTDLLEPATHDVLTRCAVFRGSFSVADAVAVTGDDRLSDGAVRAAVADLVDANLIENQRQANRYRCLETIRHYGQADLADNGELERVSHEHGRHFAAKASSLGAVGFGPGEAQVLEELLAQVDDYRAALQALRAAEDWEALADLVWGATTVAFSMRGAWPEPVFLVQDLVDLRPDPLPPHWPILMATVASTLHRREFNDESARVARAAIELAPDAHMPWLHAGVALVPSDPDDALRHVRRAVEVSDPDRPEQLLHSLWGLSTVLRQRGDRHGALEAGQRIIEESVRFSTERGEGIGLAMVSYASPDGSPEGADTARRAVQLALLSRTTVIEKVGAMLHIKHLLHQDPESAVAPLLTYLQRPVVHTPFGPSLLAAAAALLTMVGGDDLARSLGRTIGRTRIVNFDGLAPVRALLDELPAVVDPMSIDPGTLEAMTARAIDALQDRS